MSSMECTEYIKAEGFDLECECADQPVHTTTPCVSQPVEELEGHGMVQDGVWEGKGEGKEMEMAQGGNGKEDYNLVECDLEKIPSPRLGVPVGTAHETQEHQQFIGNGQDESDSDKHHDYMDHSSKVFQDANGNADGNVNTQAMDAGVALAPAVASASAAPERIDTNPLVTSTTSPSSDAPPTTLMQQQVVEQNQNPNTGGSGAASIAQSSMDTRSASGNREEKEKEKESNAQSLTEKDDRMFNKLLHMVFPSDTEASKKKRIDKLKQLPEPEKEHQRMVLEKKKKALMEKVNMLDEMIKAVSDTQSQTQSGVHIQ